MAENAPLVTILCAQCSRHAQMRRGEPTACAVRWFLRLQWTGHMACP